LRLGPAAWLHCTVRAIGDVEVTLPAKTSLAAGLTFPEGRPSTETMGSGADFAIRNPPAVAVLGEPAIFEAAQVRL
jgi:hypothetical protein